MGLGGERIDYEGLHLARPDVGPDPIEQVRVWITAARDAGIYEPEAMTLATVDAGGVPDARMVLLKGFGPGGFRFFTNYGSAKADQLGGGSGALVLYWRELDRQVRARGEVVRLPGAESDAYFATRPRESQVGAWASPQSRPLASRAELDERVREVEARFEGAEISRPEQWGGFLLRPRTIEFWQGQVGRLHDRFRYVRDGDEWRIERLAP